MMRPSLKNLAERTGLEPATPGVTGRYSNQLNYRSEFGGPNRNGLMNKATRLFVPARPPAGTEACGPAAPCRMCHPSQPIWVLSAVLPYPCGAGIARLVANLRHVALP